MMTTHERERLAYAEGYTETAAVLARIADLEDQVETLQERVDDISDERDTAQSGLDEVGCRLHDTRAKLALSEDKVKTYRAALMAIEAEVSPAMREFIREVLA